jgi:type II secretory pathway pseudopilin PulG
MTSCDVFSRVPSDRLRGARGFTLVELMVALTGGLFVSVIVFVLARDGSRFYQRESRVANATLASIVGFERLRSDLVRAGFLTSPNVRIDPSVCGNPANNANWVGTPELQRMASLRILPGGSPDNDTLDANVLNPDRIVLAGSFASVDQFPVRTVLLGGGGFQVFLQEFSGPMARLGYSAAADAPSQAALLATVFGVGRALRVVDKSGRQHFGTITAVQGGAQPMVALSSNPALNFRGPGNLCGLKGNETGALANVVNFVQYDIRSLQNDSNFGGANPNYAPIYAAQGPGDADRTELVRVELNTAGAYIAGTEEVVAEYAVDLRFGISVTQNTGSDPVVGAVADGEIAQWAGTTVGMAVNRGPQRVRAVRARLSVRSREADRDGAINPSGTVAQGLYRIDLGLQGTSSFARVRTVQTDVALRNQVGVTW